MNIEDRVRDAYTLVDGWGPAVAPPLRRSVRRPARRRVFQVAAPLTVAAAVTAGLLVPGVLDTAPGDHPRIPLRSASAGSTPGGMSPIAMVMRPGRDDQVEIYLCNKLSANHACQKRDATPAERAAIVRDLEQRPEVLGSTYISMNRALNDAMKRFADMPGFSETLQLGDIPDSYRVTIRRPADAQSIVRAFTGKPGVDVVLTRQLR